jgi:hypothetical protein
LSGFTGGVIVGCATVAAMLLSGLMRTVAITGRTDSIDTTRVNAFFGGRQGGRWAQQTVAAAIPTATPHATQGSPHAASETSLADPAETLRELTKLHQRGYVTDAEFEWLRAEIRQAPKPSPATRASGSEDDRS